jgi:hypothetical protein
VLCEHVAAGHLLVGESACFPSMDPLAPMKASS